MVNQNLCKNKQKLKKKYLMHQKKVPENILKVLLFVFKCWYKKDIFAFPQLQSYLYEYHKFDNVTISSKSLQR